MDSSIADNLGGSIWSRQLLIDTKVALSNESNSTVESDALFEGTYSSGGSGSGSRTRRTKMRSDTFSSYESIRQTKSLKEEGSTRISHRQKQGNFANEDEEVEKRLQMPVKPSCSSNISHGGCDAPEGNSDGGRAVTSRSDGLPSPPELLSSSTLVAALSNCKVDKQRENSSSSSVSSSNNSSNADNDALPLKLHHLPTDVAQRFPHSGRVNELVGVWGGRGRKTGSGDVSSGGTFEGVHYGKCDGGDTYTQDSECREDFLSCNERDGYATRRGSVLSGCEAKSDGGTTKKAFLLTVEARAAAAAAAAASSSRTVAITTLPSSLISSSTNSCPIFVDLSDQFGIPSSSSSLSSVPSAIWPLLTISTNGVIIAANTPTTFASSSPSPTSSSSSSSSCSMSPSSLPLSSGTYPLSELVEVVLATNDLSAVCTAAAAAAVRNTTSGSGGGGGGTDRKPEDTHSSSSSSSSLLSLSGVLSALEQISKNRLVLECREILENAKLAQRKRCRVSVAVVNRTQTAEYLKLVKNAKRQRRRQFERLVDSGIQMSTKQPQQEQQEKTQSKCGRQQEFNRIILRAEGLRDDGFDHDENSCLAKTSLSSSVDIGGDHNDSGVGVNGNSDDGIGSSSSSSSSTEDGACGRSGSSASHHADVTHHQSDPHELKEQHISSSSSSSLLPLPSPMPVPSFTLADSTTLNPPSSPSISSFPPSPFFAATSSRLLPVSSRFIPPHQHHLYLTNPIGLPARKITKTRNTENREIIVKGKNRKKKHSTSTEATTTTTAAEYPSCAYAVGTEVDVLYDDEWWDCTVLRPPNKAEKKSQALWVSFNVDGCHLRIHPALVASTVRLASSAATSASATTPTSPEDDDNGAPNDTGALAAAAAASGRTLEENGTGSENDGHEQLQDKAILDDDKELLSFSPPVCVAPLIVDHLFRPCVSSISIPDHSRPSPPTYPLPRRQCRLAEACVIPIVLPVPRSTTWIHCEGNNFHVEDDPTLRYVPYFGDHDVTGLDVSFFKHVPGGKQTEQSEEKKRLEVAKIISESPQPLSPSLESNSTSPSYSSTSFSSPSASSSSSSSSSQSSTYASSFSSAHGSSSGSGSSDDKTVANHDIDINRDINSSSCALNAFLGADSRHVENAVLQVLLIRYGSTANNACRKAVRKYNNAEGDEDGIDNNKRSKHNDAVEKDITSSSNSSRAELDAVHESATYCDENVRGDDSTLSEASQQRGGYKQDGEFPQPALLLPSEVIDAVAVVLGKHPSQIISTLQSFLMAGRDEAVNTLQSKSSSVSPISSALPSLYPSFSGGQVFLPSLLCPPCHRIPIPLPLPQSSPKVEAAETLTTGMAAALTEATTVATTGMVTILADDVFCAPPPPGFIGSGATAASQEETSRAAKRIAIVEKETPAVAPGPPALKLESAATGTAREILMVRDEGGAPVIVGGGIIPLHKNGSAPQQREQRVKEGKQGQPKQSSPSLEKYPPTSFLRLNEGSRELFCRRCYIYDCHRHGVRQPLPRVRRDPPSATMTNVNNSRRRRRLEEVLDDKHRRHRGHLWASTSTSLDGVMASLPPAPPLPLPPPPLMESISSSPLPSPLSLQAKKRQRFQQSSESHATNTLISPSLSSLLEFSLPPFLPPPPPSSSSSLSAEPLCRPLDGVEKCLIRKVAEVLAFGCTHLVTPSLKTDGAAELSYLPHHSSSLLSEAAELVFGQQRPSFLSSIRLPRRSSDEDEDDDDDKAEGNDDNHRDCGDDDGVCCKDKKNYSDVSDSVSFDKRNDSSGGRNGTELAPTDIHTAPTSHPHHKSQGAPSPSTSTWNKIEGSSLAATQGEFQRICLDAYSRSLSLPTSIIATASGSSSVSATYTSAKTAETEKNVGYFVPLPLNEPTTGFEEIEKMASDTPAFASTTMTTTQAAAAAAAVAEAAEAEVSISAYQDKDELFKTLSARTSNHTALPTEPITTRKVLPTGVAVFAEGVVRIDQGDNGGSSNGGDGNEEHFQDEEANGAAASTVNSGGGMSGSMREKDERRSNHDGNDEGDALFRELQSGNCMLPPPPPIFPFMKGSQQPDQVQKRHPFSKTTRKKQSQYATLKIARETSASKSLQTEYTPCDHAGPCRTGLVPPCLCAEKGVACEKFCACDRDACARRFAGCACLRGACSSASALCACVAAGRECDPDLCLSCGACDVDDDEGGGGGCDGTCRNSNIKRGRHVRIAAGRSGIHGWGAFFVGCRTTSNEAVAAATTSTTMATAATGATRSTPPPSHSTAHPDSESGVRFSAERSSTLDKFTGAKKHDFLYEYTGELISQDEADRRGKIYDKTKCSFLFNLNDSHVVDATRKGNKLKYANHHDNANCYARIKMVTGDHRIGIYAARDLAPGEEISFNYSASYWAAGALEADESYLV